MLPASETLTEHQPDAVPLTSAQRAMLAATARDPVDPPYVLQVAVPLKQGVTQSRWRSAWDRVVAESPILRLVCNESLRAATATVDPVAVSVGTTIAPATEALSWTCVDLSNADDFDHELAVLLARIRRDGLISDAQHRTRLAQAWWIQGPKYGVWCLLVHHAVLDGNSFVPLFRRLADIYHDRSASPCAQSITFLDHAQGLASRDWTAARGRFASLSDGENCAIDFRECFHSTIRLENVDWATRVPVPFSPATRERFSKGGDFRRVSMIHAAWGILLFRLLEQPHVAFGVTRHCRSAASLHDVIGPVANVLPLIVAMDDRLDIAQLLGRVESAWDALADMECCPLSEIAGAMGKIRGGPFQSLVNVCGRSPEEEILTVLGELAAARPIFTQRTDIPVALTVYFEPQLSAFITAASESFSTEQVSSLSEALASVLEQVINREPGLLVGELALAQQSPPHVQTLVCSCPSVVDRIAEIVQIQGDSIAVSSISDRWSFNQLWSRTGEYAAALESAGIEPEDVVAILTGRSFETVAAMLGTLRAGGAFFVVAEDLPQTQRGRAIDQSGARYIVDDGVVALPPLDRQVSRVNVIAGQIPSTDRRPGPQALAYLVATSGTTGQPKVVMNTHGGLNNLVSGYAAVLKPTPDDARLQATSAGSDTFVLEVMLYLSHGARLHLDPQALHRSMPEFSDRISQAGITVVGLPSSVWREWARSHSTATDAIAGSCLRAVICSMERTCPRELQMWREQAGRNLLWINAYGPSEAACVATLYPLAPGTPTPAGEIPVGRPLPNTSVYVVDAKLRLRPQMVVGEIAIGGVGVGRGYLSDPAATAEKFVKNPFQSDDDSRLYLTGDLGYMTKDGELVFVGRRDHQVKIRGYRIELEEVDLALQSHPSVSDAAAVAVDIDQRKLLVGFFTGSGGLDARELKAHLADRLPGHAIPRRLLPCETIPRSQTGKVQRKILEEEAHAVIEASTGLRYAARQGAVDDSETTMMVQLLRLFEIVLNQPVLADEDFFEIGGDSLSAVRLLTEIDSRLRRQLSLGELVQHPTPQQLARYCCERDPRERTSLVPLREGKGIPLLICHGAEGSTFMYERVLEYVHLPNPVWGIYPIDGAGQPPPKTFAQMCRKYAADIQSEFASGQIVLCGYSLGGLIAFEIARHLQSGPVSVSDVVVVDTRPINLPRRVHWRMYWGYLVHRLGVHAGGFFSAGRGKRMAYLRGRFGALRQIIAKAGPPRVHDGPETQLEAAEQNRYFLLNKAHQPQPLSINVTLIRATRDHRNPEPAWRYLSGGNLETFALPCGHYDLTSNAAPDVGRLIASVVRRQQSTSAQ